MTLRLTLGFDPGFTGAIAVLADGEPVLMRDIPVHSVPSPTQEKPDRTKREINPFRLSMVLREVLRSHPGADVLAVLEDVSVMPADSKVAGFRFGESLGALKGVLGSLGIRWTTVRAQAWKKHHGLIGTEKDAARLLVLQRWPSVGIAFTQKRDIGRADAVLIGRWGFDTEAHASPYVVPRRA